MNTTRTLICVLLAGGTLAAAAPVFADSWHERDRDYYRHSRYDRYDRFDHRHFVRDVEHRRVVVVERPVVIERQVQVYEPAPAPAIGLGAMIGAVIGSIYDSQH